MLRSWLACWLERWHGPPSPQQHGCTLCTPPHPQCKAHSALSCTACAACTPDSPVLDPAGHRGGVGVHSEGWTSDKFGGLFGGLLHMGGSLSWNACRRPMSHPHLAVIRPVQLLDYSHGLARYAGPGAWNDFDMLGKSTGGCSAAAVKAGRLASDLGARPRHGVNVLGQTCPLPLLLFPATEVGVGNRLSLGEQRLHFALWALLKSPLIIGADLRKCVSIVTRVPFTACCA